MENEKPVIRCEWARKHPLEQDYHDSQWGLPLYDDQKLFEMLCLESAQAGLSWLTILQKRENYRKAFENFDINKVADFSDQKVEELLKNKGIIRNRMKIKACINNANCVLKIQNSGQSFSNFLWDFVKHQPIQNSFKNASEVPAKTEISEKMSKSLKQYGFNFLGPTICYAFMQSTGMTNDHIVDCFRHKIIKSLNQHPCPN